MMICGRYAHKSPISPLTPTFAVNHPLIGSGSVIVSKISCDSVESVESCCIPFGLSDIPGCSGCPQKSNTWYGCTVKRMWWFVSAKSTEAWYAQNAGAGLVKLALHEAAPVKQTSMPRGKNTLKMA